MKKQLTIYVLFCLFVIFQANGQATEPYTWDNVAIGGGGFVSGVFFSPIEQNVIYARTDVGGAYRWNEGAQSWESMMDWVNADERGLLGIEALTIDPSTPGALYMMAGTVYWNQADDGIGRSAFLRSTDYGETWEKIPVWDNDTKYFNVHGNGMGRGNGERLAIDPANSNTMFYGTRNKGLWTSSDNGSNWSKVSSFPVDTTWNGCGISFVAFDPSTTGASETTRIYVGVLRKSDNLFVSEDAGATWSIVPNRPYPEYATDLMPQRIVIVPDGSKIITTWGNGAGPHTMQWDEGWGDINDWFNRGAVFEYEVATQTWTDISPQDLIDPEDDGDPSDPSTYYGCYSGISIDPNNPDHMVVSSIASYRGPQFWYVDGTWYDEWGDNIFVTEDGGETWVPSFQYYWIDGGYYPNAEQMDENGIPWMIRGTIHWIGSTAIDPYNPQRVFVTSGNGVFKTEDIFNYEWTYVNEWGEADTSYIQSTVWQVASHGIEEVVPEDVVSIPDGPLVSVIGDYDGFMHDDITSSPSNGRHKVTAAGSDFSLGSTTGLAYASQDGRLAKCAKTRSVSTQYSTIPIGPVQWSDDNGLTWSTETYTSNPPTDLLGGKVALSADGAVTLWMPSEGTVMYRNLNTEWTEVSGISFSGRPVGDQVDENLFYVYNNSTGYMMVSTDKGVSFSEAGYAGTSNFRNAVAAPGQEGHVYVPIANYDGTGALMRSTDGGTTFTAVSGVDYCEAVGFGKAATGSDYPTIFVFAEIDDVTGVWRSTDEGASWVRVNDDDHEYGGLANGEFVVGDMNVFGRVYMSTAGRGIVYGDPAGSVIAVTGVTISPDESTVGIGSSITLEAVVAPSNATNQSVGWYSDNSDIATVSSDGEVTGVSAGSVVITVSTSDGGFVDSAQVIVENIAVTGIEVDPSTMEISAGSTGELTATILPENATNQTVYWTSSDEGVATVDENGLVSAVAPGTTDITATTDEGGFAASSVVTVTEEVVTYVLTTTVTGSGTITADPDGGEYEAGTVVTLTATASSGYEFSEWTGDVNSTSAVVELTMDDDKAVTAVFEAVTGEICDDPSTVSVPITHNGSGEYCYVTSGTMSYINSWNMEIVQINGVDYTNTWSSTLPDPIDGQWYIYLKGNFDWSHFEAAAASTSSARQANAESVVELYPNPFTSAIQLDVEKPETVESIEVLDNLGRRVLMFSASEVDYKMSFGEEMPLGMYYVKIHSLTESRTFIILKQ